MSDRAVRNITLQRDPCSMQCRAQTLVAHCARNRPNPLERSEHIVRTAGRNGPRSPWAADGKRLCGERGASRFAAMASGDGRPASTVLPFTVLRGEMIASLAVSAPWATVRSRSSRDSAPPRGFCDFPSPRHSRSPASAPHSPHPWPKRPCGRTSPGSILFRWLEDVQTFDRHHAVAGGDDLQRVPAVGQVLDQRLPPAAPAARQRKLSSPRAQR